MVNVCLDVEKMFNSIFLRIRRNSIFFHRMVIDFQYVEELVVKCCAESELEILEINNILFQVVVNSNTW